MRLYIGNNINLTLVNEDPITDYVPDTLPPEMPVEISEFVSPDLYIVASDALTTVPAGHKLLIQATYEKQPPKNFINPSNYSPTVVFNSGYDLSISTSISRIGLAGYGQFTTGKRICIKSCLINTANGAGARNTLHAQLNLL